MAEHPYAALPSTLKKPLDELEKRLALNVDPLDIDATLDKALYSTVFALLPGKERTARQYFIARVDLLNLIMALRALHMGKNEAFLQGLLREALLIDALDGLANKLLVAHHQQGVLWQELQNRLLLFNGRELWHDVHAVAALLRQLVLNLEGADGVDIVAKEIKTKRKLMTVGIDIEDGATQGKLTRFIDIVNLAEAKLTQGLADAVHADALVLCQCQTTGIQLLARHHHLGQCLRIGDNI